MPLEQLERQKGRAPTGSEVSRLLDELREGPHVTKVTEVTEKRVPPPSLPRWGRLYVHPSFFVSAKWRIEGNGEKEHRKESGLPRKECQSD
jgi:hypothetical protein